MNAIDDYEKGFNQCSTLVLHLEEKATPTVERKTLIQLL